MRYFIYRLDTRYGATYKVTTQPQEAQTRAACIGHLEAQSKTAAATILKGRLKNGLRHSPAFLAASNF